MGHTHFLGNGVIFMSPTGGMKAKAPPSRYLPVLPLMTVLALRAEYNGIKQDAATASISMSMDSNFEIM